MKVRLVITRFFLHTTAAVFLLLSLAFPLHFQAAVQDQDQKSSTPQPQKAPSTGTEAIGPSADTIKPYKPARKDPFRKEITQKQGADGSSNKLIEPPSLAQRRIEYTRKLNECENRGTECPEPFSAYLIRELEILGFFQDPHGPGVFMRAQVPNGPTFYLRRGSRLYDGELTQIEPEEPGTPATVKFREVSYYQAGKKTVPQERIVAKTAASQSK